MMKRGFTLVEMLLALGMLVVFLMLVVKFEVSIFSQNEILGDKLQANQQARQALKLITAELRAAAPSETGAYPIAAASQNALTFFSDVDGDGVHDQVRYFLNGSVLERGVITPTGAPLTYNLNNEATSTLAQNINDPNHIIFTYFDKNYAGATSPLSFPVDVSQIRLVKVALEIDPDPSQTPSAMVYQTQVVIRSLKDNL